MVDVDRYWEERGLARLVADFDARRRSRLGALRPIAPVVADLVRLHRLVRERRRVTVLEFGSGYSTVVLAHALQDNEAVHAASADAPPFGSDAFRLFSVDTNEGWLDATRAGLPDALSGRVKLCHSEVRATTFAGHLCHQCDQLPDVVPDFIYLDGPDPRDVVGTVNGLGFAGNHRVPMAADILLMESTLLPLAIILVDGRTANARFLARNLQRSFRVEADAEADVTIFELDEAPLGPRDIARRAWQSGGLASRPGA